MDEQAQFEMMQQNMQAQPEGPGLVFWLFFLGFAALMIASLWKINTKAGQPGWACIVPFYNYIVLLNIVGRPVWWIVLMLIPFVNTIVGIIILIDLAKSFGKGVGFGLGLAFLGPIFLPILAFSDAQYEGAAAAQPSVA
jgi:hypothetical protein